MKNTTTAQKGLWAEQIAYAHFCKQPNTIVMTALNGVGLCDFATLNTQTGRIQKYDVKYGSKRWHHGDMRLIHRVPSAKQKKLNIKMIYVMEDGTVTQPKKIKK